MHSLHKPILLKVVALIVLWTALCDGDSILRHMSTVKDSGKATNCGKVPFNFSWSPKILSAKHALKLSLQYTTPYQIGGGFYNLTLTEYGEPEPFISYANSFTCDDVKKYVPCPIPKGLPVDTTREIAHTKYLLSFPGRYILRAELQNEKHQQMICLEADVTINNNI